MFEGAYHLIRLVIRDKENNRVIIKVRNMIFALRKVPKYLRWFRRKIKVTSLRVGYGVR